ncbi:MAG: ABC transporter substrate-binding protein [Rhodospirillaceae bacterium]|nr:ABC transporter substrate-binding protein [Rhodospirillaceae bacterium]MBL6930319.1 ABC transporter substrate-binding protein [Rhodospirillales bacterium]
MKTGNWDINVGRFFPIVLCLWTAILCLSAGRPLEAATLVPIDVEIIFLSQKVDLPPALSNIDSVPDDAGLMGARIAIGDNNTTGRFLKHKYSLIEETLAADANVAEAFARLASEGGKVFILDLPASSLDIVRNHAKAGQSLLFNTRATDDRFRSKDCHDFLLHTIPSRAMRTDSLAQYLITKRWKDWLLIVGSRPEDELFAQAIRKSAKKFGADIIKEKKWTGEHDARRTAQTEVPLFTQGIDYDVLMVADEIGDFGDYLMYRTWTPRLVAGTQGLVAKAWGRPIEQWGAAQLQERFLKESNRWMLSRDYAAWAAVRTIGEAVTRTKSGSTEEIRKFIASDKFQLAAFKGRKLSFRTWNGQLRMPVAVMSARSVVAQPPLKGYLHQRTELDTLGLDKPESSCGK